MLVFVLVSVCSSSVLVSLVVSVTNEYTKRRSLRHLSSRHPRLHCHNGRVHVVHVLHLNGALGRRPARATAQGVRQRDGDHVRRGSREPLRDRLLGHHQVFIAGRPLLTFRIRLCQRLLWQRLLRQRLLRQRLL